LEYSKILEIKKNRGTAVRDITFEIVYFIVSSHIGSSNITLPSVKLTLPEYE
jgi:hypothetical protein